MFNKIILVGNCTKDGELRYTQGGTGIYSNSLAVTRQYTVNGEKKEESMFVDFTAFGRTSEVCNQYLNKGSKILVEGRLNFEQWVDQNGQKRSKHSVTVETMQMLGTKNENTQQAHQQRQAPVVEYQNAQGRPTPPPHRQPQQPPVIDMPENEVPF